MKIDNLVINNFRSIKHCSIHLDVVNAIVGQNNSGKSSILRALNVFFHPQDELENFLNNSHRYKNNTKPSIEITFSDVPVKRPFSSHINRKYELRCKATYERKKKDILFWVKDGQKFKPANKNLIDAIQKEINFILIPAIRNYKQTVANEQTILKDLLEKYLEKYTEKRDNLSKPVKNAVDNLSKVALQKVSLELEKYYQSNAGFKFTIEPLIDISYKLLIENLSLRVEESGKSFKLVDCGSGVQSLSNISIYRLYAALTGGKIILGIEEPEINLHPQAQKEFLNSAKNNGASNEIQLIMTTHSPIIIDSLEHQNVILCRKEKEKNRGFKTSVYQLSSDFWDKYSLHTLKYKKFFRYHNSEFFFANHVIIVEGTEDAEVVNYLSDKLNINLNLLGISILNFNGIRSLQYPYYLLKELKIPKLIIVDKDFFLPYSNDSKEKSRDKNGFFTYKKEFKDEPLIKEIIPSSRDRMEILSLLNSNHSKAMTKLEKYQIICFKYNLEMDLVTPAKAKEKYYKIFSIPLHKRNSKTILIEQKKAIKNYEIMKEALDSLDNTNLPNSYKKIKKHIQKLKKMYSTNSI